MNASSQIDYLVIGHICRDIVPGGYAPGGTAVYSALAAQALGCRTAMVTSADSTYDVEALLPGVAVHTVPADKSTTFKNVYVEAVRKQYIYSVANQIQSSDVPAAWQRAPLVHLGPIAGEIAPDIIRLFSNSIVGLTPQGWFRRWAEDGRVYVAEWPDATMVMPMASVVITSLEDLPDAAYFDEIRRWSQLLVLTHGKKGCTVYSREEERYFAAPDVAEVNPTGAGDIFATAFLLRFQQTNGNPWEAAQFANKVAASSVSAEDLFAKANAIKDAAERR